MKVLTRKELKELIGEVAVPAVSIYMPTFRSGKEVRQNPVRLKNLLGKAGGYLDEKGLKPPERDAILKPGRELLARHFFWNHQSDGLALFLSSDTFRYYRLPSSFEELVVAADRFHVTPLLRILSGNGRFFLLAFSKNRVRMFEGTRYSIREIQLPDVPEDLEEDLRLYAPQKHLQFHTGTSGRNGRRPAVFHGQGAGADKEKEYLRNYLHRIAEGVNRLAGGERAPLLIAGVDYLLSIYAEINTYPHLIEEGIAGNPDRLSEEDLHKRAWPVVSPYFQRTREEDAEKYRRLAGTHLSSDELVEVIRNAYYGRVDSLFADAGCHRWGTFDPETGRAEILDGETAGADDLVDFAAAHTILNGGRVHPVEREEMPADSPLAAILRF